MNTPPAHAASLDATREEAFRLLSRGVADRRSPFHTPTLATIGLDGAPRARTLVLRGFDPAARILRLHTDLRSAKVEELARDGRAALHLYDAGAQVQIRIAGQATLHATDAVAEAAWAASRAFSRRCYAALPAPGQPVPAPVPSPTDPESGRGNFAAILLAMESLDWLWLWSEGHRRARFAWGPDGALSATWLAP